jgi:hypothetical protein
MFKRLSSLVFWLKPNDHRHSATHNFKLDCHKITLMWLLNFKIVSFVHCTPGPAARYNMFREAFA